MIRRPSVVVLTFALTATVFTVGCSSSGGNKGDKAAFCRNYAAINAKLEPAKDIPGLRAAFKASLVHFNDLEKTAPDAMKADAKTINAGAHLLVSTGDPKAFSAVDVAAAKRVDAYCGGSTTTTT